MLYNLAVVREAEEINSRIVVVAWPMLEAVQNDVVAVGQDPFELDPLAGVFACHAFEIVDKCLFAVADTGIVLDIHVSDVFLDSLGRSALIEHQVVKGDHVLLVAI